MINVLLVDDHTVLRDGLRFLLEAEGDAPPMHRLEGQRLEDQQVKRALQQVGSVGHGDVPLDGREQNCATSLDGQEEGRRLTPVMLKFPHSGP